MKLAFIDESGSPRIPCKDLTNPYFALTAVIFDAEYYFYHAEGVIDGLKLKWFKNADHILHLEDIRDKRDGDYTFLNEKNSRELFHKDLNDLLKNLDFQCVSVLINIPAHEIKYGKYALNPLKLAHDYLGERLQKDCARLAPRTKSGRVFYEECNYQATGLNKEEFMEFIRSDIVCKSPNIRGYHLSQKSENLSGIQIADFCSHPIRRHVAGLKPSVIDPDIVVSKLICNPLTKKPHGWGLKIFP